MGCGASLGHGNMRNDRPLETAETITVNDPTAVTATTNASDNRSPPVGPSNPLAVRKLDLNIEENAREHNTDRYEVTDPETRSTDLALVTRRGQPFDLTITFNRDYSKEDDTIRLRFEAYDLGSNCTTEVEVGCEVVTGWKAEIVKDNKQTVDIRVSPPAFALIAKYKIVIETQLGRKKEKYKHVEPMFLLCNPWCEEDTVYLENKSEREEYVLNDKGRVYRGSSKKIRYKSWNFGHFEDFMLDVVFYLLNKSKVMKDQERADSVLIARTISLVANQNVLHGRWNGKYDDGTSPLKWTGSVKILEQYWKTKKMVKYGQCWVFSCLVTTLCRCLGIPARSMTNFQSAHDSDNSVTIDSFYNTDGEFLDNKSDSVWNFHVWNDVWMARPDLEPGFGGWQALDGTAQEKSRDNPGKGQYACGPVPLIALKRGNIDMKYDAGFVFASFNGDRVTWDVDGKKETPVRVTTSSVGKYMSTKSVGRTTRNDVTDEYKHKEGSPEERATVIRAVEKGARSKDVDKIFNQSDDVEIDLVETEDSEYTPLGKPFDAEMKFSNKSNDTRTIDVTLRASLAWYNGKPADLLKKVKEDVVCEAGKDATFKMTVDVDDYIDKLVDMCFIKVSCMARVKETNQIYFDDFMFMLDKPNLKVEPPATVEQGDEYDVTVSFTNPFPYPLTKCVFTVEGAGHMRLTEIDHKDIPAGGEGCITRKVVSTRRGEREIVAGFDSVELSDLNGEADVIVLPRK